jgi:RNA polymerase sigma-70 factor (ECF subfamily)
MRIKRDDCATRRQTDHFMTNWDTIVANDGPAVWSTLWRLLANREDVEECFQETFLAALKVSRRQAVDCWPALLCTLATARAMDRLRTRYRRAREGRNCGDGSANHRLTEATSTDAGPAEHAVAGELSERLRVALSQLPERQAEVFYLFALCGWSHRELGERMRMTENAVGVIIHRARQRLRELLNDGR